MPLPPALAAKLQKRGILQQLDDANKRSQIDHEEVIAEDYDDVNKPPESRGKLLVIGCPNKYNIYHDCTYYCQKRWGNGKQEPSPRTKRKYQKLLKRYPLSDGWSDVYDPGVGCYYFWNTNTDEVSWLPPHHPKARISISAEKMKALLRDDDDDDKQMDAASDGSSQSDDSGSDYESTESESNPKEFERDKKRRSEHSLRRNERNDRIRYSRDRQINKRNDLDPMDPASYSDIPRGKWSDGLESKGDAKTGVDSTASGPLFQMRPYPNPGAVLRMNSKGRNAEESDDDDD